MRERLNKLEHMVKWLYCKIKDGVVRGGIPKHNELEGLQGGQTGEY